jgi:hypothetical protein
MKTVSLLTIVGPREGDLRPPPAKLRLKVLLRGLLCIIVSAGVPDLAWAQYGSGGQPARRRISVQLLGLEPAGARRRQRRGIVGDRTEAAATQPARQATGTFPQHLIAGASGLSERRSSRHSSHMSADSPPTAPTMPGRAKATVGHPCGEGNSQGAESRGRRCPVRGH